YPLSADRNGAGQCVGATRGARGLDTASEGWPTSSSPRTIARRDLFSLPGKCFVLYRTKRTRGRVERMARSPPPQPIALIVEDDHLIALDLERAMSDLGYVVCLAASESRARFLAMQRHPDIVLMDVCLGREGIETGRWLRAVCGTSVV